MSSPNDVSPVNPLPPVVVALVLVIVAVELAFQAGARGFAGGPGAVGWRLEAIRDYAFFSPVLDWMLSTGRWPPGELARFVTYPFVHGSFTHVLFVAVFVLALGKLVSEVFGPLAVIAVFFVSSISGALVYALAMDTDVPLLGGFPAAYGLIGAYSFLLWTDLARTGGNRIQAFRLIGVLMAFQLIFGLLFGGRADWIADIAGFVAGFAVTILLTPGALARMRDRLRQR